MIADSHRRRKRQENVLIFFFFVCATIINELPVISCFSFFEGTLRAASMRPPCLIYLSTSTGVRTGCHYSISLFVCLCICNIRGFY